MFDSQRYPHLDIKFSALRIRMNENIVHTHFYKIIDQEFTLFCCILSVIHSDMKEGRRRGDMGREEGKGVIYCYGLLP